MSDFRIAKTDESQRIVFGYASVVTKADGSLLTDTQGDLIEPEELEKGAYAFMHTYADSGVMHKGESQGRVVESFVVTKDKLEKMGLVVDEPVQTRWWIGVKVNDETFGRVTKGELRMFSVQGRAKRTKV